MITVGTLAAVSMRLVASQRGAWFADIDLDLLGQNTAPVSPPTGKVTITISSDSAANPPSILTGTVDPVYSGRFLGAGRIRVTGGGAGWAKLLPRQQFQQSQLPSTTVYNATAAAIGETILDPAPVVCPLGYVRIAGAASRVFGDRQWYVDPITGVTTVAAWPTQTGPSDMQVLGYDGNAGQVEVASSSPVWPGMQLTDSQSPPRWDGTLTVVDVEQTFSETGNRAVLMVSNGGVTRLIAALISIVREASRRDLDRCYQYRVVSQAGALLTLQAVNSQLGAPDLLQIPVWTAPGVSAMYAPGQTVLVLFADGDPGNPKVVVADPTLPLTSTLDATAQVSVGPTAALTKIGAGPMPLALGGPTAAGFTAMAAGATTLAGLAVSLGSWNAALAAGGVAAAFTAMAAGGTTAAPLLPTKTVLGGP